MKNHRLSQLTFVFVQLLAISALAGPCEELFFSEYVEGTSYNRAVEIYNPTNSSIDLEDYEIHLYNNGNSSPVYKVTLSDVIGSQQTYVVVRSAANYSLISRADYTPYNLYFTGDDAIALVKNGVIVDLIGKIGEDPGSGWVSDYGTVATTNHTLVRKPSIQQGVTTNPSVFNPSNEWIILGNDEISDLGIHLSDCDASPCGSLDFQVNSIPSFSGTGVGAASVEFTYSTYVQSDFEYGIYPSNLTIEGAVSNTNCASVTGNALYFYGGSQRYIQTSEFDFTGAGRIGFDIIIGSGAIPCDNAESYEDVVLEYSTNGSNWSTLKRLDESKYTNWTRVQVDLPLEACTDHTRLRIRQLNWNTSRDNWAIDDLKIEGYSQRIESIVWSGFIGGSGTSISGLYPGMYTVNVTTESGCAYQQNFEIEETTCEITGLDGIITSESAFMEQDGSIEVIVSEAQEIKQGDWYQIIGGAYNANCDPLDGSSITFNGSSYSNRLAQTVPFDATKYQTIQFDLKFGTGYRPCENADAGENVVVEASLNGMDWYFLYEYKEYQYPDWQTVYLDIPNFYWVNGLQLRFRQLSWSGSNWDAWSLDNVKLLNKTSPSQNNYLWLHDGSSQHKASHLSSGYYTVYVSDQDNCWGRKTFQVSSEDRITSTEQIASPDRLTSIYPNPSSDRVNLQVEVEDFQSGSIEIINSIGQLVYHQDMENVSQGRYTSTLNLGHLTRGLYTLNIKTNKRSWGEKLILQK